MGPEEIECPIFILLLWCKFAQEFQPDVPNMMLRFASEGSDGVWTWGVTNYCWTTNHWTGMDWNRIFT